jgi:hypothetical protein
MSTSVDYEAKRKHDVMLTINHKHFGRLEHLLLYRQNIAMSKSLFEADSNAHKECEAIIEYCNNQIKEILGL